MSILARYILRSVTPPFIFGFSVVIFLFLMQFLMTHLQKLVGKGLSEWVVAQLIIYNIAWMTILAVPMGVLFGTLLGFGSMSANHEITVMKASGGSLLRAMRPVIIASIFVTAALFWFNDVILPEANHKSKLLLGDIQRTKPTFSLESGKFSSEMDGHTIMARHVDSLSGAMTGVTVYKHDRIAEWNVISADSGFVRFSADFENLIVDLFEGEIHQFKNEVVGDYKIIEYDKFTILMSASGFAFSRTNEETISRGDREQSISDMKQIVGKAQTRIDVADSTADTFVDAHWDYLQGISPEIVEVENKKIDLNNTAINKNKADNNSDTTEIVTLLTALENAEDRVSFIRSNVQSQLTQKSQYEKRKREYQVEIQKKYAIPFACILFVFVGCPLGIITRGGNFGFSAAISLLFYVFYWACLIGGEKLADRGHITPQISMWLGNAIIALLGVFLTLRVNNESFRFFSK